MATKKICDRCGAEINPADGSFYAGMSTHRFEGKLTHELCHSCAYHLCRWLDGKERIVGEQIEFYFEKPRREYNAAD